MSSENPNVKIIAESDKIVAVKITAKWCPPCKLVAPIVQKLSETPEWNDVVFLTQDHDLDEDFSNNYEIKGLPTVLFFYKTEEIGRIMGHFSEVKFTDILTNMRKKVTEKRSEKKEL